MKDDNLQNFTQKSPTNFAHLVSVHEAQKVYFVNNFYAKSARITGTKFPYTITMDVSGSQISK